MAFACGYRQAVKIIIPPGKCYFEYLSLLSIGTEYSYLEDTNRPIPLQAKNPFEHLLRVVPSDIDDMGHVNNVVYLRWVQEVASAHWNHSAPQKLRARYSWVVLRHEIDYKNPAFLADQITGITWVGEFHGARFDRFVTLLAGTKVLAEAKTTWCLLDAQSLRPTRIPEEIISLL